MGREVVPVGSTIVSIKGTTMSSARFFLMAEIAQLFDNNRRWSSAVKASNPTFFSELAKQQTPPYLWIGCSDSRVPPNEIVGLPAGQIFVHRNVANVVSHTDFNCLSVLQFAVDVLKVKHVIVCGHYGCGGVEASLGDASLGLIDNWLRHVKDVYEQSDLVTDQTLSLEDRIDRLCELNVAAQVKNVRQTTIVQDAWRRKQELAVHGWIYSLQDGLLKDLG
jgi:carbonic anhydrase